MRRYGVCFGVLLLFSLGGCGGGSDSKPANTQPKGKVAVRSDVQQFTKYANPTFVMKGTVEPADADVTVDGLTAQVTPEGEVGRWTSRVRLTGFGQSSIRIEGRKAGYITGTVDTAVIRTRSAKERAIAKAKAKAKAANARAKAQAHAKAVAQRKAAANAPVTVPSLVGERLDVAKREVRASGLSPVQIDDEGTLLGIVLDENWTVCRTQPAGGTSAKKGSRVHLYAKKSGC
jgi:PASTA domain